MSLWNDIQPYLDPQTGLLLAPDGGTDNLVLYSAYLIRELGHAGDHASAIVMEQRVAAYMGQCEVAPGLYRRSPGNPTDNSVDNMIGACYASWPAANAIRRRWYARAACFDVNQPAWRGIGINWYGRFVGLKSFIKQTDFIRLSWWDKFTWSLACIWSTYASRGASDPLLQSLQNDVVPGCRFAKWLWGRRYSVKSLYAQYFGPSHPLTLAAKA